MPLITLQIQPNGPILTALIHVSTPRFQALTAAKQTVPPAVTGLFLLDTGASSTCVDPALIASLALPQIGAVMISTPSTGGAPVRCDQFDASIMIPGSRSDRALFIPALPIIETHLRSQGIDLLIGRDEIDGCMLVYNGPTRSITLAH